MSLVCKRRGVRIAAVALGLGQAAGLSTAAEAGFFDFLFGPPQVQAPSAGPVPFLRRRFHRHAHKAASARRLEALNAEHPARPQGPVDLMDDESLRRGDAVMTPAGVRIFIGYAGSHHTPQDFRIPSEVRGLSKRERKALAALDDQGLGSADISGAVTGRSVTQGKVAVGEKITDAKGRTIRYVGP
jgi:hypothetical protein